MQTSSARSKFAAFIAAAAFCAGAHADVAFSESDFNPGSWSVVPSFLAAPASGGASFSVVSNPIAVPGGPMRQDFQMNPAAGAFNVIWAPIMLTGWTHDPSVQGQVQSISAAATTIPQVAAPPGFGALRLFLFQNGKHYTLDANSPNFGTNFLDFQGHNVSDPMMNRTATGLLPIDFVRVIPDGAFDFNDHPSYSSGPMSFGFGYSLTTSELPTTGSLTIPASFDNLSVRISTIPAPGAATILGIGGLLALPRRRR